MKENRAQRPLVKKFLGAVDTLPLTATLAEDVEGDEDHHKLFFFITTVKERA